MDLSGNVLDDDAEVLVCTCNATGPNGTGAMGKGIAKAFATRWPSIVAPYRADCEARILRGGAVRLYPLPEGGGDLFAPARRRWWAAFCTKHDWRNPSRYEWVQEGLATLSSLLHEGGHASVAIPPLGCGEGGLSWERVRPMIAGAFAGSPVDVRVYAPFAAPSPRGPRR